MKLFTWEIAPNPRRVKVFLKEKGVEIPSEDVGVSGKPYLEPNFLKEHPHRRVPLLRLDDGSYIAEAMAICRYFEALYPDPPLMGSNPRQAGLIDMWERLAESEGLQAIAEFYRNSKGSFSGRSLAGYEKTLEQIPALVERGEMRLNLFYKKFDDQLANNKYVAGNCFSVADITTICTIDFANFSKLGIPKNCRNLQRWYKLVSTRPSVSS